MGGIQVSGTHLFSSRGLQVEVYCLSQSWPETPGEELFLCWAHRDRTMYTKEMLAWGKSGQVHRLLRIPRANGANLLMLLDDSGRSKFCSQFSEL